MRYSTQRLYIVIDKFARDVGMSPFILAEVAGAHIEREPAVVIDGRVVDYVWLDGYAREAKDRLPADRIASRQEVESDPDLRQALARWQAGDDRPLAEYERLTMIEGTTDDGLTEETALLAADDAKAHGPIFVDA